MDRQIAYPGQLLPETNLLQSTKDAMIGLAKLSAAVLGTSTIANGFAVTPTGPASLQVLCAPGEIYSLANIDALAFSTLPADTTHSIMKQGILLDGLTLNCPAPGTTGQSINYLIQATYQDTDATPVLLPYYNSANPSLPFSGMGNNGLPQNTVRKGSVIVAVKAGASAATGSQVTPAPDSSYVGLYVVTVAFGQTTITTGSISQYSGAPLLPAGLVQAVQSGKLTSATDIGTANAYSANFAPAITTLNEGLTVCIKAANANTGASTFTPAPGVISTAPIVGAANAALQGGEIVASGDVWLQWNTSVGGGSWIILDSTGGALQISPATKSQHALQLSQAQTMFSGIVGSMRNAKMNITAASASGTFTAEEIIVESTLGGQTYRLANFNKTINLASTGANGMDTGTAPVSGFVSIYAIYNQSTSTAAILACNQTTSSGSVYTGANMPSGYTASALISAWGTTAASLLAVGAQVDRRINVTPVTINSSTVNQTGTSISIASIAPTAAKEIDGLLQCGSSASSNVTMSLSPTSAGIGSRNTGAAVTAGNVVQGGFTGLSLITPTTVFYTANAQSGALSSTAQMVSYSI